MRYLVVRLLSRVSASAGFLLFPVTLLLSFFRIPYGYYQFVKYYVLIAAILCMILELLRRRAPFFLLMLGVATIFNPLFPPDMPKNAWRFLDLVAFWLFLFLWADASHLVDAWERGSAPSLNVKA
jgi:hypothetical protein